MSLFKYQNYVKDLLKLLKDPRYWLGKEREQLKQLNELIVDYNNLYNSKPDLQKICDDRFPTHKGPIDPINNINDGDRLLFAVFGPMHPMNPSEKVKKLREFVEAKTKCLEPPPPPAPTPSAPPPSVSGTAPPPPTSPKQKYLKYKNKYLQLKSQLKF